MIYDHFRVTGAYDTVLDYADLFTIAFRNDDDQEYDTRWGEILLCLTKIPTVDFLESLYKLRIRESDQLKNVLDLYGMEIHQNGEEEHRSETSITKFLTPDMRELKQVQLFRVARDLSGIEGGKGVCC